MNKSLRWNYFGNASRKEKTPRNHLLGTEMSSPNVSGVFVKEMLLSSIGPKRNVD